MAINLKGIFNRPKRNFCLGIDRGTHTVRYVLFDTASKQIEKWGSYEMVPSGRGQGFSNEFSLFKELARQIPLYQVRAIQLNAQGSSIVMGKIQIPKSNENEQANLIRLALRSKLSYPVEEAVYYCSEFKKEKQGETNVAGKQKIVFHFVAISKRDLNALIDPVEENLKKIPHVSIQGYAYETLIEQLGISQKDRVIALINIGRAFMSICIYKESRFIFQRDIPLAGQDLTRSIMVTYRKKDAPDRVITLKEAEEIKRRFNIPMTEDVLMDKIEDTQQVLFEASPSGESESKGIDDSMIYRAASGVLSAWVQDIKSSFHYFQEHYQMEKVDKVYLFGGSAVIGNLVPYLTHHLKVETALLPLSKEAEKKWFRGQDAVSFKKDFHAYVPALAYSQKRDTTASFQIQRRYNKQYLGYLFSAIRVFQIFVLALLITWYIFLNVQDYYLRDVQEVLISHQQFLRRIESPYLKVRDWGTFLKASNFPYHQTSSLLKVLSRRIPPNLLVTDIQLRRESGNAMIRGLVFGNPKDQAVTLAEFSRQLKQSHAFRQIEVPTLESSSSKPGQGKFYLTAKISEKVD